MYKESLNRSKSVNISKSRHQEKLTSVINKKKIRSHLDKLIREFNFLPKKTKPLIIVKHVTKTLFWATVYLAFSYLTVTSTFKLIQQYRDNPVKTKMKAIINNNVTYLPNMTICLKINARKLFNVHSSSSFNYTSAWYRFFEETVSSEGIFKVNESQVYEDEIYFSLLKYLAMIYEAERAWEPGLTQISTFHSEESDDWIALKKILVPNIIRFDITLEQLKSVFDGKFCSLTPDFFNTPAQLLNLLYASVWKIEPECIAGSKISFIGMDKICFRLIGYQNNLTQLGTTEQINLNMYDDGKKQTWCQEFTIDLGTESRSTPRRATTRNETYGYYYNRFTDRVYVNMDIGLKALYRKLPYVNGEVQCSSDTTREECESKCLRGWIRANCHCSPITFDLTILAVIASYLNCTVDDYSICLKKYAENATYSCTDKCVPLCDQWHYEYNLLSAQTEYDIYLLISLRTFDYVIIEQVFTWNSFEEFIGALGGALGIWLGLDFVIITECIFTLSTKLIKKILLRNGHNSEEDEHRKSANIKSGEENIENGMSSSNEIGSRIVGHQKKDEENASEIGVTGIRQIKKSQKQRTSRKKRESNPLKEKHVQQRRRRSDNNRVDSALLDDKMKVNAHGGRIWNQKVNITGSVVTVQDESTVHTNNTNIQSWFLQKMLFLASNGGDPTNKLAVFLQLLEKLFWAVIYLIGSVFTIIWCVGLIILYLADEAVYYPSLIINRTVSLSPPSLCILHYNNHFLKKYENMPNALKDYFGQSNVDRVSFIQISEEKAWPEPLVTIGLFYFSILSASEINNENIFFSFISEYKRRLNEAAGKDKLLKMDIDKSLKDILLPKLLEWNITANELQQKLGAELARMVELKITFTNSNGAIDIVKEASFYTAAITDDLLCYSLSYAVNFTDQDDVLEFSTNKTSYPQRIPDKNWPNYIILSDFLLDPKNLEFDIDGANVAVYDSTYFLFYYGEVARKLISVDGLYTSRPEVKDEQWCSLNMTKSYCHAQCRIKLIEKLCNCSPTYWAMMIQPTLDLNECTFDLYMECLNYNESDDLDCKDSCLPFCTAQYFRSDLTRHYLSQKYEDTAIARLSVKDGMYASIEEKPTFTFTELLITV